MLSTFLAALVYSMYGKQTTVGSTGMDAGSPAAYVLLRIGSRRSFGQSGLWAYAGGKLTPLLGSAAALAFSKDIAAGASSSLDLVEGRCIIQQRPKGEPDAPWAWCAARNCAIDTGIRRLYISLDETVIN